MAISLTIILPCYNEEEVLQTSLDILSRKRKNLIDAGIIDENSYLMCIDDGSIDKTWQIIEDASKQNTFIIGVKLSQNSGHQSALLAGLKQSLKLPVDAVISMDADLQDDIDSINEMIARFNDGNDIVYGVRNERNTDTYFKRKTANVFYDLMKKSEASVIPNHSDFRLMNRRAIEMLMQFDERNLFLRGIVPLIGMKHTLVYYKRKERIAGHSKYSPMKMISFAIEGITSFSVRPIRMIFVIGLIFLIITLSVLIYVIISMILGRNIPGWASLMLSLWFIGSLVLMALGIIGEYVSKIYLEVKRRPRYFIEKVTDERLNQ